MKPPRPLQICLCIALMGLHGANAQNSGAAASMPTAEADPPPGPEWRRIDERRPDMPFTVDLFGKPVQLGGTWDYSDERRSNFDLDIARARDRRVREHEIKLEGRVKFGDDVLAFAQLKGLHETRRTQGTDGKQVTQSLERGEMWVQHRSVGGSPWLVQAGRIPLLDRRAWWWDEDLDGVRARYSIGPLRLDTGLLHELARKSSAESGVAPALRGVTRWFGQGTWAWAPRHAIDMFWLVQNDASPRPAIGASFANEDATDPSDLQGRWIGLRASGEWRPDSGPRVAYWADTAWLSGHDDVTGFNEQADGSFTAEATTRRRVRGNAFDVGATVTFAPEAMPTLRPALTVGYARGSSGFRQTGLQENKARFSGVKRLQRYGELLQPELANLSVATVAAGVRVLKNSSLELAAHQYRQVNAAKSIAGSRLSTDPEGTDRAIGREVDLTLALREWKHVELIAKVSHFKPGAAFAPAKRDSARAVELAISINF